MNQRHLAGIGSVVAFSVIVGCAHAPPPRSLKGQMELEQAVPSTAQITMVPPTAVLEKNGIEITARYATKHELDTFFSNKVLFGRYAGDDPYPESTLVFYVKIANRSGHRIRVTPDDFVMIDDLNIQYINLSPDDISAIYESRGGDFWSFAKATGNLAPGYYGAPFKVAETLGAGSGRRANYLVRQARLTGGYIHTGVTYDGYIAFPRPHPRAKTLKVILANIKMLLDAADIPTEATDFEYNFHLAETTGGH